MIFQIMNHEDRKNLNLPIRSNEMQSIIKSLKSTDSDGFTSDLHQIFMENTNINYSLTLSKNPKGGNIYKLALGDQHYLELQPDKYGTTKRINIYQFH